MDGYPRGVRGGGGTRWGYRPGASPTDWPEERGRNFDPCGNFFHGFLYPHCAPAGHNPTQRGRERIVDSQNRALGHPVNSTGTRRMTADLLDECIGLLASIGDHAHSDRRTLADFRVVIFVVDT
jgi:hypothetical protein